MKIGIPRALLYYWYGFSWQTFWEQCGVETVISPFTDRTMIAAGARAGVDELCLPIKIFMGHVRQLAPSVDWILVPHLIKVQSGAFLCPKFMGLPDLLYHALPELREKFCRITVEHPKKDLYHSLFQAAQKVGIPPNDIPRELPEDNRLPVFYELAKYGYPNRLLHSQDSLHLGILGHPYCIYDACFNLNLLQKLVDNGVAFLTPEMTAPDYLTKGSGKLNKDLFWTMGRMQFDALEWMLSGDSPKIDGFIRVSPFACGPEAMIGDLLERRIKKSQLPLLELSFEEQSGEAGMITRLEAFLDLIKYRSKVC